MRNLSKRNQTILAVVLIVLAVLLLTFVVVRAVSKDEPPPPPANAQLAPVDDQGMPRPQRPGPGLQVPAETK